MTVFAAVMQAVGLSSQTETDDPHAAERERHKSIDDLERAIADHEAAKQRSADAFAKTRTPAEEKERSEIIAPAVDATERRLAFVRADNAQRLNFAPPELRRRFTRLSKQRSGLTTRWRQLETQIGNARLDVARLRGEVKKRVVKHEQQQAQRELDIAEELLASLIQEQSEAETAIETTEVEYAAVCDELHDVCGAARRAVHQSVLPLLRKEQAANENNRAAGGA